MRDDSTTWKRSLILRESSGKHCTYILVNRFASCTLHKRQMRKFEAHQILNGLVAVQMAPPGPSWRPQAIEPSDGSLNGKEQKSLEGSTRELCKATKHTETHRIVIKRLTSSLHLAYKSRNAFQNSGRANAQDHQKPLAARTASMIELKVGLGRIA